MKKYNSLILILLLSACGHSVTIYNASKSPLIIKASDSCSSIHHVQPKTIQPKSHEAILNIKSQTVCLLARLQNNEAIFRMQTILNTPNNLVSIQEDGSEIKMLQFPN